MKQHGRDNFYVVGEGIYTTGRNEVSLLQEPSTLAALRKFRFSRLGPQGDEVDDVQRQINEHVADAMTDPRRRECRFRSGVPAGYTYLGQFVDHDLTVGPDRGRARRGRHRRRAAAGPVARPRPRLALRPRARRSASRRFYEPTACGCRSGTDGVGRPRTTRSPTRQRASTCPRAGAGSTPGRSAGRVIPDPRNDENLAVAQTHLAFIRFHNSVVDKLPAAVHAAQRCCSTRRREPWSSTTSGCSARLPAADRRRRHRRRRLHQRPQVLRDPGRGSELLSRCGAEARRACSPVTRRRCRSSSRSRPTGSATPWCATPTSGTGSSPAARRHRHARPAVHLLRHQREPRRRAADRRPEPGVERLPSNWIADFRRLYDFGEAGRADLVVPAERLNRAKRIDTLLVNPLRNLPAGTFGGPRRTSPAPRARNLAFRNLDPGADGAARHRPADGRSSSTRGVIRAADRRSRSCDGNGGADARTGSTADAAGRPRHEHAAVVLHPARGRAERRPADRRRRPDRRRDVPPRDGGQQPLDRPRPGLAADAGTGRHHLPHGRPAARGRRGKDTDLAPLG